ncbi:MAG: hypothetical protein V3V33_04040 [Candidatus Lokiarchaeia archaeon]
MELSSKKGSKYAKEVIDKHKKEIYSEEERNKKEIIIEKFENSLDILYTMFWNLIQLKTGSRIGMSVSMDLTRDTSKLFTERVNKFHNIVDKYREILNERIIDKMGKYFDIFAPTGLLTSEEFLKSEIALNILKEFINKYNRTLSSFNHISVGLKQLTDISKLEGDYKDPQIMKDKKFIEVLLKLMVLISKPPKGIYDFFS